jgi:hypothetical protein
MPPKRKSKSLKDSEEATMRLIKRALLTPKEKEDTVELEKQRRQTLTTVDAKEKDFKAAKQVHEDEMNKLLFVNTTQLSLFEKKVQNSNRMPDVPKFKESLAPFQKWAEQSALESSEALRKSEMRRIKTEELIGRSLKQHQEFQQRNCAASEK